MAKLNGCHNRKLGFDTYPAQDGWDYSPDGTTRTPRIVQIKSRNEPECQYDKQHADAGCVGCCRLPVDAAFDPDFAEVRQAA